MSLSSFSSLRRYCPTSPGGPMPVISSPVCLSCASNRTSSSGPTPWIRGRERTSMTSSFRASGLRRRPTSPTSGSYGRFAWGCATSLLSLSTVGVFADNTTALAYLRCQGERFCLLSTGRLSSCFVGPIPSRFALLLSS